MSQCKHLSLLRCWNILNSNLELELLGRSELAVLCTYAFNRILSMPRSNLSSVPNSIFYVFVTALSVLQCHHFINAETFG